MFRKISLLIILLLLGNCSTYYYYHNSSDVVERENRIDLLNSNIKHHIASSTLSLNSDYQNLNSRYASYLKSNKKNVARNFKLYLDMTYFLDNADIIKSIYADYSRQGGRYVYDLITKDKITFVGFYWTIDDFDEFHEFAIKNLPGVKEYEDSRIKYFAAITEYRNKIFQQGKEYDEARISKLSHGKDFCKKSAPTNYDMASLLSGGVNLRNDCIYCACSLRVVKVANGGVIATSYNANGIPAMSNIFLYSKKKYTDHELITPDKYAFYVKDYHYKAYGERRVIKAFREFDISQYPFVWMMIR